jgi:tissue factor pathway inhibitor
LNSGVKNVDVFAAICALEKVKGPCKAKLTRHFYNTATGNCEEFIYGGCNGNKNNFETIEECQKACLGK